MRTITIGRGTRALTASVWESSEALGDHVGGLILTGLTDAGKAGRRYLLGCPGGRTAQTVYRALARQAAAAHADLAHVVIVMMDDYVIPSGDGFEHCPADAHYSCRRFAFEEIAGVINRGLPAARRIRADHVWLPSPAAPQAYEEKIHGAGGIDLFLTASGASDGHVAFNAPGSALDSRTRIVPLLDSTRRDNLATFPEFTCLDEVPRHGVTVGLGTICSRSRQVMLLIHGPWKIAAVARLSACSDFDPQWPASFIFRCPAAAIHIDEACAQGLAGARR